MTEKEPVTRKGARSASIRDVARRAGVSIATVSGVITGSRYVSPELTARVKAACDELDYHPNALARALYGRRSHMIAFLVPSIANPGFAKSLQAVEETARARGYSVFVANTNGSAQVADSTAERLLGMRIDGLIVALTWELTRPDFLAGFQRHGIKVVGISAAREVKGIDCILGDELAAGESLGNHLISLGHSRAAYICPKHSAIGQRRLEGLQNAFRRIGKEIPEERIGLAPAYDEEAARIATMQLLQQRKSFTALVVFNDLMAAAALRQLVKQGIRVPHDMSVATFGDMYAHLTSPSMTTMAYPEAEAGRIAATTLLDRIDEVRDDPPFTRFLPIKLITRESTAPIV